MFFSVFSSSREFIRFSTCEEVPSKWFAMSWEVRHFTLHLQTRWLWAAFSFILSFFHKWKFCLTHQSKLQVSFIFQQFEGSNWGPGTSPLNLLQQVSWPLTWNRCWAPADLFPNTVWNNKSSRPLDPCNEAYTVWRSLGSTAQWTRSHVLPHQEAAAGFLNLGLTVTRLNLPH